MVHRSLHLPTRMPDIRKGDTVIVLGGKDAGKRGVVDRVMRRRTATYGSHRLPKPGAALLSQAAVVIEGINVAKRHTKPRQSTNATDRVPQMQQGGILDIAQPLPLGKVMLVCPRCDKPTRVRHARLESGISVRVCRHCGEQLEVTRT
ncbi:MAG TPA: 50S ribosomal protein L24 [Candidatus Saccharimonadales bacterium]|nr:50S ribosomal protein L24 [Candidatus Saccharimonadales bacterium]